MRPSVYVLDDDVVFAQLLKANLGTAGEFDIELFHDPEECLAAVAEAPPDVLLTDLYMEKMDGVEVAGRVRSTHPHLPIYVLTARGDVGSAIEAMKAGANDYLIKPVNVSELTVSIRNDMKVGPLLAEAVSSREKRRKRFSVEAILGEHPLVNETRRFVKGIGPARSVSVLLLGESGVGKNLTAHAIHLADPEAGGQYVELNCSAIPASLMEAELFGYMKGAFTGAHENKPGMVEVADGGTLFLDEIAEMPSGLQAKLLNFVESRRFRRLGGTREREVDVRIVAATNRDVDELVGSGAFREDLFYRISAATHKLPPLRDIRSDIPLLVQHFAEGIAEELGKPFDGVTPEAEELLKEWEWPGNVRELRNVIERALIFAEGPMLEAGDLPKLDRFRTAHTDDDTFGVDAGLTLKEVEREYIRLTMERLDGNVQEAAEALGISRKNLWEKRKKYGLDI